MSTPELVSTEPMPSEAWRSRAQEQIAGFRRLKELRSQRKQIREKLVTVDAELAATLAKMSPAERARFNREVLSVAPDNESRPDAETGRGEGAGSTVPPSATESAGTTGEATPSGKGDPITAPKESAGPTPESTAKLVEAIHDEIVDYAEERDAEGRVVVESAGPPSNLTPEEWKIARSSAFVERFGDWRNEPIKSVDTETGVIHYDEDVEPVPFPSAPFASRPTSVYINLENMTADEARGIREALQEHEEHDFTGPRLLIFTRTDDGKFYPVNDRFDGDPSTLFVAVTHNYTIVGRPVPATVRPYPSYSLFAIRERPDDEGNLITERRLSDPVTGITYIDPKAHDRLDENGEPAADARLIREAIDRATAEATARTEATSSSAETTTGPEQSIDRETARLQAEAFYQSIIGNADPALVDAFSARIAAVTPPGTEPHKQSDILLTAILDFTAEELFKRGLLWEDLATLLPELQRIHELPEKDRAAALTELEIDSVQGDGKVSAALLENWMKQDKEKDSAATTGKTGVPAPRVTPPARAQEAPSAPPSRKPLDISAALRLPRRPTPEPVAPIAPRAPEPAPAAIPTATSTAESAPKPTASDSALETKTLEDLLREALPAVDQLRADLAGDRKLLNELKNLPDEEGQA